MAGETDIPEFAINRFTPFRLSVLSNRMTRAVAQVYMKRFRLSAPEWRTMAVLGLLGEMTANAVVERTAMDKVRVSRAVARMLRAGFIVRAAAKGDRRRLELWLSREGSDVYQEIIPLALAVEADLLAALTAEERTTLDRLLSLLQARAEAVGGKA